MAVQLDIASLAARLDEVMRRVQTGEEIEIVQQGQIIARVVPADENPRVRALGMFEGQVWIADDFNEMTEEELRLFEDGPVFPPATESPEK